MAGRHRVEAQRERPLEHRGELDLLVAAQARVGGAAGGVLVHEVLDHVLVEPLAEVPDVERDADHVGRPARVVAVLDGAAAAGTGAVGLRVAREGEVDAGDVVAGFGGAGGGHCRVDAAGHGGEDLHDGLRLPPGPLDDRVRSSRTSASTSAAVRGVAEGEPQRVPGRLVVAAHREQHVRGLGHAGRAGRAGGALDAASVEQHQQRVALAVGEAEVGVAGQPLGRRVELGPVQVRVRHLARARRRTRSSRSAADPSRVVGLLLDRQLDGCREPAIAGGVDGARADVALLAAAVQQIAVTSTSRRTSSAPTP